MNKPILSICIPTYNRSKDLKECLDSIVSQFNNKNVYIKSEIVISDNHSKDDTEKLVNVYKKKYNNIRYFKNKKNFGGERNQMKAASYAKGEYIWFFADDDLQKKNSIKQILEVIEKTQSDIILCNYVKYLGNKKNILYDNCFQINQDLFLKTKKNFFNILEKRFFYTKDLYSLLNFKFSVPVDPLVAFMSSVIIKNKIFKKNITSINKNLIVKSCFSYSGLYLYTKQDYSFYLIADTLVYNRLGNLSWGKGSSFQTGRYWGKILGDHYQNICYFNNIYISYRFKLLVFLREIFRFFNINRVRMLYYLNRFYTFVKKNWNHQN